MKVLGDFGLARDIGDATHATTCVAGTNAYLDPSYLQSGQLTRSSDLYSFGVLLLQLLTDCAVYDRNFSPPGLVARSSSLLKACAERADSSLMAAAAKIFSAAGSELGWTDREIVVIASLASSCLEMKLDSRPTAKEAAAVLLDLLVLPKILFLVRCMYAACLHGCFRHRDEKSHVPVRASGP